MAKKPKGFGKFDKLMRMMMNTPFTFDPARCNHMGKRASECPHCLRHKAKPKKSK